MSIKVGELAADKHNEDRELLEGFELLGADPEECDVEYAWFAQCEALQWSDEAPDSAFDCWNELMSSSSRGQQAAKDA